MSKENFILANCTIIDGSGERPQRKSNVGVKDGIITQITTGELSKEQEGVIDCQGKFVLPGLIDMHAHFFARATSEMKSQYAAYPKLFLAGGVTTVRSPGEFEPVKTIELKNAIDRGEIVGPRINCAGPYFDRNPSIVKWIKGLETTQDIEDLFFEWRDQIDFVKAYSNFQASDLAYLIELAHNHDLYVTAHLGAIKALEAIKLGIDGLEHGIFTMGEYFPEGIVFDDRFTLAGSNISPELSNKIIEEIVANDVFITPTTITFQIFEPNFYERSFKYINYLSDQGRENHLKIRQERELTPKEMEKQNIIIEKQFSFINRLYAKGATLLCGSDPSFPLLIPGYSLHWEMKNFVLAGISPLDTIKAATSEAAKVLKEKNIGTISAGKIADIVVLNNDPLENIENIGDIFAVIAKGKIYNPKNLRKDLDKMIS